MGESRRCPVRTRRVSRASVHLAVAAALLVLGGVRLSGATFAADSILNFLSSGYPGNRTSEPSALSRSSENYPPFRSYSRDSFAVPLRYDDPSDAQSAPAYQPRSLAVTPSGDGDLPARSWSRYLSRTASFPGLSVNHILMALSALGVMLVYFARTRYTEIQRVVDVIGSIIALSLLLPVVAFAAILIKIDSPGPIFIKQVRVGINRRKYRPAGGPVAERRSRANLGSLFTIYKLRTMRADAEAKSGPVWARENDNRITRIGRILRKTHLDEIPQFLNVLKGDMSIVGPRPERPLFINQLNDYIRNYDKRLNVKPGITGLAQVRYQYAASVKDARIKLRYDLLYVRRRCLSMDLRILINTFNLMVSMKGAR